jgi:hypothetical protein
MRYQLVPQSNNSKTSSCWQQCQQQAKTCKKHNQRCTTGHSINVPVSVMLLAMDTPLSTTATPQPTRISNTIIDQHNVNDISITVMMTIHPQLSSLLWWAISNHTTSCFWLHKTELSKYTNNNEIKITIHTTIITANTWCCWCYQAAE